MIDALGEIRPDYGVEVLDAIRASGLAGCVITLGNPALHGPEAWGDFEREYRAYEAHLDRHPERLARVRATADIDRAAASGRIGLLYDLQNAALVHDDLERLRTLRNWGVRIVQLTYNTRNLLGDGCLERTDAGLSRLGVEAVERMNALGLVVDASHCGEATTLDALEASRQPVALTHSGCRALYDHPRNKSDAVLQRLAARGGVIGIYQINPFLGPKERNTLDDYLAHIDHAVRVAGVEHVGIGSDREYRTVPDTPEERQKLEAELARLRPLPAWGIRWPFFVAELNHPRRMETVRAGLERRGYRAGEVEKILGGNFYRLLRDVIS